MKFAHLAQRLFNAPLAIHPRKAEVVMAALAERLGITRIAVTGQAMAPMAFDDDDDDWFSSPGETIADDGYDLLPGGVARIPVTGTLVQKLGTLRPYSGMTGYDGIRQAFMTALADDQVKAIALAIDSPGGECAGCFDLADAIASMRGVKPIWAMLEEVAFSAAYAIASAADVVTVPQSGGTGSIGVICMHVDWSKAIAEAGLQVTFIHHGARKADGRPELPLSKDALEAIQSEIDTLGALFDQLVARNRGIDANQVRGFEAATFLGQAGVALGLADRLLAPDAAYRALLAELA